MEDYPYLAHALAEVLEEYRTRRRLSKSALADLAHIQRNYLLDLLAARKKPTLNAVFLLCRALHVHPSVFVRDLTKIMQQEKAEEFSQIATISDDDLANDFFDQNLRL